MKIPCLILLFQASLQLQCDKGQIAAHIGGEFILSCKYDTNHFLFNKKYWCRGDSRGTCEILADSEHVKKTSGRFLVLDARRKGLFVKVTGLQLDDTGVYWVGIDKIYADIMTSVNVFITEVPVSKPRIWPLTSLADRSTCWGHPVTVRCGCAEGTDIRYAWYQRTHHKDLPVHPSSDLYLHCGSVEKGSDYYCVASNDISTEESEILSVQVLLPADRSCSYAVNMQGQNIYDCTASTTEVQTPPLATCKTTVSSHSDPTNQLSQINQTHQDLLFKRTQTWLPLWYTLLRWGSFASLLIFLCVVLKCTKTRLRKSAKRKRRVHFKQVPHLVQ
ncbi:uncharacterized protein LOC118317322 [Scophthalmus maximus]|uniref:uncharacterized protein LOC118317322 n=1 Tax=Scophthalmus maximus TaxID=52904 RepID=UPI0015E0D1C7|nr:uncharacterized protein LOC118317322 [Scophthalmus maximus]